MFFLHEVTATTPSCHGLTKFPSWSKTTQEVFTGFWKYQRRVALAYLTLGLWHTLTRPTCWFLCKQRDIKSVGGKKMTAVFITVNHYENPQKANEDWSVCWWRGLQKELVSLGIQGVQAFFDFNDFSLQRFVRQHVCSIWRVGFRNLYLRILFF